MGTRISDKHVNYSHELAQTKQQVDYYVVGTLLVHGRTTGIHRLTRLTMLGLRGCHHLPPYSIHNA
jgi:hypothetical protein